MDKDSKEKPYDPAIDIEKEYTELALESLHCVNCLAFFEDECCCSELEE